MVNLDFLNAGREYALSVLALSSRFDGPKRMLYELLILFLSVLALSSRFDGQTQHQPHDLHLFPFSTRSVESF